MQKTFTPPFSSSTTVASIGDPALTNDSSAPSTWPFEYCALLPAICYTETYKTLMPEDDVTRFLNYDLDVARLNYIHEKLRLAGRPKHYISLHRQKMMKREIIITEQTDLHLTWYNSAIYIKPFPRYLGSHEFWTAHLCERKELHEVACGFVFSYTWLISCESDFNLALKLNLIPPMVSTQWRIYIQDVRRTIDIEPLNWINRRYLYGELRLQRLNWIYRFYGRPQGSSLVRGYFSSYRTYHAFFVQNFTWVFVIFVYVTIVLTAMQVGLATEHLQSSQIFQDASYGFAIFSITVSLIITGAVITIFLILFFYNLIVTLLYRRDCEKEWFTGNKVQQ